MDGIAYPLQACEAKSLGADKPSTGALSPLPTPDSSATQIPGAVDTVAPPRPC